MKILIAYDGTESADAAIVDLPRAGLPQAADVVVLSVSEVRQGASVGSSASMALGEYCPPLADPLEETSYSLKRAENFASQAADRLKADFPQWRITKESWVDTAAGAITRKAMGWKPDLIVMGSHGECALGRVLLGSVSDHVLHRASTSVRISRHHLHPQDRSIRLILGCDGSPFSKEMIDAVANRNWPAMTEIRVVGVRDTRVLANITDRKDSDERHLTLARALDDAVIALKDCGCRVETVLRAGNPKDVLVEEGESFAADCVFLGAKGETGLRDVLLGSVAHHVAAHARCSVEVVRTIPMK